MPTSAAAPDISGQGKAPSSPALGPSSGCSHVGVGDATVSVVPCAESGVGTAHYQLIPTNKYARQGESVTVAINGLSNWAQKNDPTTLRLYLAGQKLSSVVPTLIFPDQDYINFKLRPDLSNQDERKKWIDIVDEARRHQNGEILISAGPDSTMQPFPSSVGLSLIVYPRYTPLVEAFLAALLVILLVLAWRTDLLRDTTRGIPQYPLRAPFSLGRVQMAWWFYLVIASYLYIWLITSETNTLSSSVLALTGISAATGGASRFAELEQRHVDPPRPQT